jgi:PilZ domain
MVNFARPALLFRRLKEYCGLREDGQEERRGWGRFPSAVETTYRPANVAGADRLPARVRNVSRRGISLLLDRAFTEGDLLSVDVPGGDGKPSSETALACVIYVAKQADEGWVIGCTFSAELDDADLAAFAGLASPAEAGDERTRERHDCDVQATCQPVQEGVSETWPARVHNISGGGVGLVVTHPVEAGTLLNIDLRGLAGQPVPTLLGCVVHVTARANGESLLGCNFLRELSEEELAVLVG